MLQNVRSSARDGIVLGVALVLVFASSPARAEIVLGPRFEIDAPIAGAPAWGDQSRPRLATSPAGTLVLWMNRFAAQAWGGAQAEWSISGALLSDKTVTRIGSPKLAGFNGSHDVAFAGHGFVVVYEDETGLVALRLGNDGTFLDSSPRLLVPLDPSRSVRVVDLDCDNQGRCLLVSRAHAAGQHELEATAFGWDEPASQPKPIALTLNGADAAVARSDTGFLAVYLADDEPAATSVDLRLRAQRFDAWGNALGTALELDHQPKGSYPVLLAPTIDGHALVWWGGPKGTFYARAGRLDAQGQMLGFSQFDLGDGGQGIRALTTAGADIVLFWCKQDGTSATRIPVDGASEDLGVVMPGACAQEAAYDGTRHLLVWDADYWPYYADGNADGSDVYAAWLDALVPGAGRFVLSSADNSQWRPQVVAPLAAGEPALVVWNDNRNEHTEVFGVPFGPDGCPIGSPAPIFPGLTPHSLISVAAAESGSFVVAHTSSSAPYGQQLLARLDLSGNSLGAAIDLTQVMPEKPRSFWPNATGGLTVNFGSFGHSLGLLFVEPSGEVKAGPALNRQVLRAGRLDDDEAFTVAYELDEWSPQCFPDPLVAGPLSFRIDFFSATTGTETRAPIIEQAESSFPCTLEVELYSARDGYVFVWREAQDGLMPAENQRFAGFLGSNGEWSGRRLLPADERTGPTQVGDELWWVGGQATLSRRRQGKFRGSNDAAANVSASAHRRQAAPRATARGLANDFVGLRRAPERDAGRRRARDGAEHGHAGAVWPNAKH
jgi:hypothetical protein